LKGVEAKAARPPSTPFDFGRRIERRNPGRGAASAQGAVLLRTDATSPPERSEGPSGVEGPSAAEGGGSEVSPSSIHALRLRPQDRAAQPGSRGGLRSGRATNRDHGGGCLRCRLGSGFRRNDGRLPSGRVHQRPGRDGERPHTGGLGRTRPGEAIFKELVEWGRFLLPLVLGIP
jgi:hypothetical protein